MLLLTRSLMKSPSFLMNTLNFCRRRGIASVNVSNTVIWNTFILSRLPAHILTGKQVVTELLRITNAQIKQLTSENINWHTKLLVTIKIFLNIGFSKLNQIPSPTPPSSKFYHFDFLFKHQISGLSTENLKKYTWHYFFTKQVPKLIDDFDIYHY